MKKLSDVLAGVIDELGIEGAGVSYEATTREVAAATQGGVGKPYCSGVRLIWSNPIMTKGTKPRGRMHLVMT